MVRRRTIGSWVACAALAAILLTTLFITAGCGLEAAPQPPSLKLPQPVTDLSATRAGDIVTLRWTMPKRDTDKVLLKNDQRAVICRSLGAQPCETAGEIMATPSKPAVFNDQLPSRISTGPPQLLTYTVRLTNHLGHDAGPSNEVFTARGAPPLKIADLSAEASPEGVILRWKPEGDDTTIRIHRTLVADPKAPKPNQAAGSSAPSEQTLEVTGLDKGRALDRDAALDNTYRYTAERVTKVRISGHTIEETSELSELISIDARNIFPPHTPVDLQAVADPDAKTIDLSWSPDTETDIAGYVVYRREAGSTGDPVRISQSGSVAPSFRDAGPLPGHRYLYSVSAIDRDGNESARSTEVEEGLPQP